jgi:hypothetical protein
MSVQTHPGEGHASHHHHENRHFFFGEHRIEAPHAEMKVRDLKELIAKHVEGFKKEHTLVLEEHGDRPDKPLKDDDTVRMHDFPHFYDQPPANFGA